MSQTGAKDSWKPSEGWDKELVRPFAKNPGTCVYCGFPATTYQAWCQLVIDHFIPRAAIPHATLGINGTKGHSSPAAAGPQFFTHVGLDNRINIGYTRLLG